MASRSIMMVRRLEESGLGRASHLSAFISLLGPGSLCLPPTPRLRPTYYIADPLQHATLPGRDTPRRGARLRPSTGTFNHTTEGRPPRCENNTALPQVAKITSGG